MILVFYVRIISFDFFLVSKILSSSFADTFLTYSTVKVVQVPNTFVAVLYRLLQFIIVAYIAL